MANLKGLTGLVKDQVSREDRKTHLVAGICPGVREVHVEIYIETSSLGSFRKLDVVVKVIVSSFWIDP